jgi:hypothetical protein
MDNTYRDQDIVNKLEEQAKIRENQSKLRAKLKEKSLSRSSKEVRAKAVMDSTTKGNGNGDMDNFLEQAKKMGIDMDKITKDILSNTK